MALFESRVQIGGSRLGPCVFITVTYRWVEGRVRDAESVRKEWRAFIKRSWLKPPRKWMKVPEVTKKGELHYHLMAGLDRDQRRVNCYPRWGFDMKHFTKRFDTCGCVSHELSRVWFDITGDTKIVHTTLVVSNRGAGSYMSKYLAKTLGEERLQLERLGALRRWSSSKGWPGGGRLQLARSLAAGGPGWNARTLMRSLVGTEKIGGPDDLMEKSGENLVLALAAKRTLIGQVNKLRKEMRYVHENVRATAVADAGRGGDRPGARRNVLTIRQRHPRH